jgi:hypothetical protein
MNKHCWVLICVISGEKKSFTKFFTKNKLEYLPFLAKSKNWG